MLMYISDSSFTDCLSSFVTFIKSNEYLNNAHSYPNMGRLFRMRVEILCRQAQRLSMKYKGVKVAVFVEMEGQRSSFQSTINWPFESNGFEDLHILFQQSKQGSLNDDYQSPARSSISCLKDLVSQDCLVVCTVSFC